MLTMQLVESCLTPCRDTPCGLDPKYTDDFERIKLEIEKLTGCDYALVLQLSHDLLITESKDLRLAGYLCLALVHVHHITGLLAGLKLYTELIKQFGELLHPQNPRARASAVAWLNNPRFSAILSATVPPLNNEQRQTVHKAITDLNTSIRMHLSDTLQVFNCLDTWLASQETLAPVVISSPVINLLKPENNSAIEDDKQAHLSQLNIIHFWRTEKQWQLACQLARAWRWGSMTTMPTHQHGQTSISPPRKEALLSLEKINASGDPESLLEFCEVLFIEPGGLFFLDLQWFAYQAALSMQDPNLANYLMNHAHLVCNQHPVLPHLSFANGLPFASSTTQQWLIQIQKPVESSIQKLTRVDDILREATMNSQNLTTILGKLHSYNTKNRLEDLCVLQAKAQACLNVKRQDLALIFYRALLDQTDKENLATWLPDKAIEIWREGLGFLNGIARNELFPQQRQVLLDKIRKNLCLAGEVMAL